METSAGPSLRVLTRPSQTSLPSASDALPSFSSTTIPISTTTPPSSAGQSSLHPSSGFPSSSPANGVVVVGVVGRNADDVTQLLNRLLDAHIFGSGNRDRDLWNEESSEEALQDEGMEEDGMKGNYRISMGSDMVPSRKVAAWMKKKRISYYADEERGIVYVQFAWGSPHMDLLMGNLSSQEFPFVLDQQETDDLCGLLFMFSVCHIIVFIHEGARFDTQLLKTFRTLQASKHALAPFVKTQVLPGLLPVPVSSSRATISRAMGTPSSSSPGRGGIMGRHTSSIGLMSGSSPTLLPGQCTPVMLFVFLDDFSDGSSSGSHGTSHIEDAVEAAALGNSQGASGVQSSGIVHISRTNIQSKASTPVVMLARSTNKMEGGFRKKLQSSLDIQIRFLIKKCRTIAGGGDGGTTAGAGHGPRGPGSVSSLSGAGIGGTLFALDAVKAVALVDRSSNRKSEPLEAATGIIEEILNGKESSENFLLENNSNGGVSDDIQAIKDFLYRQAEVLRGRGGIATNSTGGSAGVGMVAAAAAAAAASAAAGGSGGSIKSLPSPPELPSLANWLSACYLLFEALIECRVGNEFEKGASARGSEGSTSCQKKEYQEPASLGRMGAAVQTSQGALDMAVACLESGKGLDMKFSAAWCKRALPAAKEVYMKGLPPCYPTAVHNVHLEKALRAFRAMVRGPAVHIFPEKLKEDCEAIWKSGRQLCDAVSLTGKPCVYQRHDVVGTSSNCPELETEKAVFKPHSSGFVFLHACACGRSRRLRSDPFDFESANITFFNFPNCEDLLPSFVIPFSEDGNPVGSSAWSLVRLGGTKYYDPSAGLLQSGFCTYENFLCAWTILFVLQDTVQNVSTKDQQKDIVPPSSIIQDSRVQNVNNAEDQRKMSSASVDSIPSETRTVGKGQQRKIVEKIPGDDLKSNSGRGFPVIEMKKAFAEVVAKSNSTADSAFPPLQQKRQPPASLEKVVKQRSGKERKDQVVHLNGELSSTVLNSETTTEQSLQNPEIVSQRENQAVLLIGCNTISTTVNNVQRPQRSIRMKRVVVYVGFEHECSHGHRFLLSLDHIEKLGGSYSDSMSCVGSKKTPNQPALTIKKGKQGHKRLQLPDVQNIVETRAKPANGTRELIFNQNNQPISQFPKLSNMEMKCEGDLQHAIHNEGEGPGFSLLNMDLPIYMNCPHCKTSARSKKKHNLKFASTVSQLQRIFLVTPPFPTVLSACPVVQFENSCLPASLQQREQCSRFTFGSKVILPPESFLTLRLPFVYGARIDDSSIVPLFPHPQKPEQTAWIVKGTTLEIVSKGQETVNVPSD